jgi:hypothetical protein
MFFSARLVWHADRPRRAVQPHERTAARPSACSGRTSSAGSFGSSSITFRTSPATARPANVGRTCVAAVATCRDSDSSVLMAGCNSKSSNNLTELRESMTW